jgi:hypothetical protein
VRGFDFRDNVPPRTSQPTCHLSQREEGADAGGGAASAIVTSVDVAGASGLPLPGGRTDQARVLHLRLVSWEPTQRISQTRCLLSSLTYNDPPAPNASPLGRALVKVPRPSANVLIRTESARYVTTIIPYPRGSSGK